MTKKTSSPMELGELESSPDLQASSPLIEIDLEESVVPQISKTTEERNEEPDDVLTIKPPQQHTHREKHKHRHRNKKSSRGQTETKSYDKRRDTSSRHSGKEKSSRNDSTGHDGSRVTSRDVDRSTSGEHDEERRNKSLLERERLERLERERHRIERERSLKEREHQDKIRAEQQEEAARVEAHRAARKLHEGSVHNKRGSEAEGRGGVRGERGSRWRMKDDTMIKIGTERQQKSSKVVEQTYTVHRSASRSPLSQRGTDGRGTEGAVVGLQDKIRDPNRRRERRRDRQREEESDSVAGKIRRHGSAKGSDKHSDFQGNYRSGGADPQQIVSDRVQHAGERLDQQARVSGSDKYNVEGERHRKRDAQSDMTDVHRYPQSDRERDGRRTMEVDYAVQGEEKERKRDRQAMKRDDLASESRGGSKDWAGRGTEGGQQYSHYDTERYRQRHEEKHPTDTRGQSYPDLKEKFRADLAAAAQRDKKSHSSMSSGPPSNVQRILSISPDITLAIGSDEEGGVVRESHQGKAALRRLGSRDDIKEQQEMKHKTTVRNSSSSSSSDSDASPPHKSRGAANRSDSEQDNSMSRTPEVQRVPGDKKYHSGDEDDNDSDDHHSNRSSRSSSSSSSSQSSADGSKGREEDILATPADESPVSSDEPDEPMHSRLPIYYPALQGCRNVEEFNCLNRIEEGTYGVVYRAVDRKTGEIVALKRLKMEKEKEGFPITSLREINTLLKAQHKNIVTVREIVVGSNMDKIYIVMDYVEHDLKSLMETMKEPFIIGEVKTLMLQLLRGIQHIHDNWIIHRDLKTSNLLLSHKGILKIGDFGLAREYGSPLKQYTPIVVTLWYRAPELLLGAKEYSTAIDLWSAGCIFAEFLTRKPLFPGKSEIDELNRIFKELGTPTEKIWPGVSELPAMKKCTFTDYPYNQLRNKFTHLTDNGFDLLIKFLTYSPLKRITAVEAQKHDFFSESPLPVDPSMFPTWPAKSEMSRTRSHGNSPKPPSGGKAYANLIEDDVDIGFHLALPTTGASFKGPGFSLKF